MVRMKYNWIWRDGLIVSDPVLAGHDTYEVSIVYNLYIGYFIYDSKGRLVIEEQCKNVNQCKRRAKAQLRKLGAIFFDEIRGRTK